jgi:hypothetical protein
MPHCPTLAAGTLAAGTPGRPRRPDARRAGHARPAGPTNDEALPRVPHFCCRTAPRPPLARPVARRGHARRADNVHRADNARPPASNAAPATPAALLPCSSAASLSKPHTIRFAWCSAMRSRAEHAADAIARRVCSVVNSRCLSVSCSLVGSLVISSDLVLLPLLW